VGDIEEGVKRDKRAGIKKKEKTNKNKQEARKTDTSL
jgi:hypothetical protein